MKFLLPSGLAGRKYLERVLAGGQRDDLERVLDDADGQQLLARVAAVGHHGVHDALNDGALCFAERLLLVSASGVRHKHAELALHTDEILQGRVADNDIGGVPLVEKTDRVCVVALAHFG